jgi:hypothetical protein
MWPALDPAGHRVTRMKPTCLLHTWRPHGRRLFALVLHLHQHELSRNLHLQYLAKNQSTQRCQSLITQESNHPPVLEPHMVLTRIFSSRFLFRSLFQSLTRRIGRREIQSRVLAVGFDRCSLDRINRNFNGWVFWFFRLSCPRRVKGGGLNLRRCGLINISPPSETFSTFCFLAWGFTGSD